MITEIGIAAGDIWHYLDHHGKSSLFQVAKAIDIDKDIIFMSIGWLAREGHIVVEKTGPDYQIFLRR
jgi:hypothetical protein